ncbi:TIGR02444 family protein [Kineobactrum sediminis]|uniref:TIGR02444 family protein n=1 Tax=Kineobactrum sediminis TaxID=1905677 RepID=A0A2N5Y6Y1_9GAMM|nr:TIGR02444 family protein [Kineobactrum sediminis]PLW84146.1 TIGR02444 family protein [Kineobactrum sediminis]
MMNNALWAFSLHRYQQPGVAEACLEAQDYYAADVNLLLYAAWLQAQGQRRDAAEWSALGRALAPWRQRVVVPLRQLRRDWRGLPEAQSLRERLKVLELEAEREQQAQIWRWHGRNTASPATPGSLLQALDGLLDAGGAPPARSRQALVQRLHEVFLAP